MLGAVRVATPRLSVALPSANVPEENSTVPAGVDLIRGNAPEKDFGVTSGFVPLAALTVACNVIGWPTVAEFGVTASCVDVRIRLLMPMETAADALDAYPLLPP